MLNTSNPKGNANQNHKRHYFTTVRTAMIKKNEDRSAGKDMEERKSVPM
jgi:hypothetical protein